MEQMAVPEKDLSDKNEDNKYEPFTFDLKPDLHYVPDKTEQVSSSSSSSSSTDSEDDDDFIQLDTISLVNSFQNPYPNNDPGSISHKNPNPDELLFVPTLQPVSSTHPGETMNSSNKPATQDASRIPSSIFTTQSTVPPEWSIASAESLFSLKSSNSSFTLENSSFNEWPPDSPTPPTPGSAISMVSDVSLEGFGRPLVVLAKTREGANDEGVKENEVVLGTNGGRLVDVSCAKLRRSGSASSMQSFAFPVLTVDEKNESIEAIPQTQTQQQQQLESQPDLTTPSISLGAKPESETKSEPEPALSPSSNSDQLTQPPQTQVMAAPNTEEPSAVTDSLATTNERPDTDDATKASSAASTSSGSICSCCSFGS